MQCSQKNKLTTVKSSKLIFLREKLIVCIFNDYRATQS